MKMGDWHSVMRGHDASVGQFIVQKLAEECAPSGRDEALKWVTSITSLEGMTLTLPTTSPTS